MNRVTYCARCGEETCDGCVLEQERDDAQGPDALDPLEAVRVAHRAALSEMLARAGRPPEVIAAAIERTRKRAA